MREFFADENGVISTDWVVIAVAIVLFAAATAVTIKTGAETAGADTIGDKVAELATQ